MKKWCFALCLFSVVTGNANDNSFITGGWECAPGDALLGEVPFVNEELVPTEVSALAMSEELFDRLNLGTRLFWNVLCDGQAGERIKRFFNSGNASNLTYLIRCVIYKKSNYRYQGRELDYIDLFMVWVLTEHTELFKDFINNISSADSKKSKSFHPAQRLLAVCTFKSFSESSLYQKHFDSMFSDAPKYVALRFVMRSKNRLQQLFTAACGLCCRSRCKRS